MFRLFRCAICLLWLAALSVQGFAAAGTAWPEHEAIAMKRMATASVATDQTAGMDMAASTAGPGSRDNPDCPPDGGCGDVLAGHCLSPSGCNPLYFGMLGASLLLDIPRAAPPAVTRSPHRARFLTGAPERPPRQVA